MVLRIEPQSEILPGYRLLHKLGSGGYGEVWKAEAPGGLHKAVKIIHADLDSSEAVNSQRTEQELNALRRVQAVRHPYLLSLERYDVVSGRLVIVTELADGNLWDRFCEFRQLRQAGIPRDDLLRYMLEAAEVLDLMNNQYQLQHLDIKPQNLFLVHDHVKVADFGLVCDLDGIKRPGNTGGVTPIYAAPETFEGVITPYCDQYSLAIVYQEMLTGKRPFSANNLQQLISQHLQSAPELTALPPADRPMVARALSKIPEDRFPSCRAFVMALLTGAMGQAPVAPPAHAETDAGPTVLPSPDVVLAPEPWTSDTPATQVLFRQQDEEPANGALRYRTAPPEENGDGVLFPAVVIGIGQIGLEVLQRVKLALVERFGDMSRIPPIRLLHVDTDPATTQAAVEDTNICSLAGDEVLSIRLNRAAHYLKPRGNGRSILEGWFDPQVLYRIKAGNPLTQGLRCLGRLAFCDHYRAVDQKLSTELERVTLPEAMDQAEAHSQLGLRSNRPRVYVVTSLAGGTGGGMFIDLAYAIQHRLKLMGYQKPDVVGTFLLPPLSGPSAKPIASANTFAALTELNHFSLPGVTYTATLDEREYTLVEQTPPFSRFSLLPIRSQHSAEGENDGVITVSEFLWRDLVTPFGRAADLCRQQVRSMPGVTPDPTTVAGQSYGLAALHWPRRLLAEEIGRRVAMRLVQSWNAEEKKHLHAPVQTWVHEQWHSQGFEPEAIVNSLRHSCDLAHGQAVEAFLGGLAEPFSPRSRWSRGTYDSAAAFAALSTAVELLGQPIETGTQRPIGRLETALAAAADLRTKDLTAAASSMVVSLVEQPEYRIAAAELAIAELLDRVQKAMAPFEPILHERRVQAERGYLTVQHLIESDIRRKSGAELAEALKQFVQTRYKFLLAKFVVQIFGKVQDQLKDTVREVEFMRRRLAELNAAITPTHSPERPSGALLPVGCKTIGDAVTKLAENVDPESLRAFDRQIQDLIGQQFTSLVQICQGSADLMESFGQALLQTAYRFMRDRLSKVDVAELYLARYNQPDRAKKYVTRAFTESESTLEAPDAPRDSSDLLAVPLGPSCQRFLNLVAESLPTADPTVTVSPDDIVFFREQVTVPLKTLPHLGTAGKHARDQLALQQFPTHARNDIRQWYDA